jgi:hypothetical protein
MKKVVTIVSAGAFMLASCGGKKEDSGGTSSATKKNLEASAAIGKMFETNDFSKLGDYVSAEFTDYAAPTGPVKGIEENKKSFAQMSAMMDSSSMETVAATGNDEYTMTWMKMKGKMKADGMGMKAGQWMDGKSIEVTQFKDGKAIAHWTYMDPADMMKMMGSMPPPPQVKMDGDVVPDHVPVP